MELTEKLLEFEKNCPITNDAELRRALIEIIDTTEINNEADIDMIDEAVDLLSTLDGVDIDEISAYADEWGKKYMQKLKDRLQGI